MASVPSPPFSTVNQRLDLAKQAALADSQNISRLVLDPVARGTPGLDIASRLVAARALLTMEGASTLTLTAHDPDWQIEESGLLDPDGDGRLHATDVLLDTLVFRLTQASRQQPEQLAMTLEDRPVALLRGNTTPKAASRGKVTRGGFIGGMVAEVRAAKIFFYSPESLARPPVARPDYPSTVPAHGTSGFDDGVRLKIDGHVADAEQMRNAATILGVCDELDVTQRVRLAELVAAIGENKLRVGGKPSSAGARGVFQLIPSTEKALGFTYKDTEAGARVFATTGFYKYGGAIKLAAANPTMSVGEIASRVEGSATDGQNAGYYQAFHDDAKAIADAWNTGKTTTGRDVVYAQRYQFTRGLPGRKESSWDAATRLAAEVNWRFYVAGGVAVFTSDDYTITQPASLILRDPTGEFMTDRPTYDWDNGKIAGSVELHVSAQRWAVRPGSVVLLDGRRWGPIQGRWIVLSVDQNLFDVTDCIVTLTKPMPPLKEPAPSISTRHTTAGSSAPATGGASTAIAWAQSKVGHFKEDFANNQGAELNELEGTFNMLGEPWCAIFATTAVAHGAGDSVKTASVPVIRGWAAEGSHGYEKGLRAHAEPGDLLLFGGAHVAFVETVSSDGRTAGTIEGNTSAGKVARLTRLVSSGDIVRPAYLS